MRHLSRRVIGKHAAHGLLLVCLAGAAQWAGAARVVLSPDAPAALLRGTRYFKVAAPVRLESGDIVEAGKAGVQIEDDSGTLALLAPGTRLIVNALPGTAPDAPVGNLQVLSGWLKVFRPSRAAGAPLRLDTPQLQADLRNGSAVVDAQDAVTTVFLENGAASLSVPGSRDAATPLQGDQFATRAADHPVQVGQRPGAAFVAAMPRAFRDPLFSMAAKIPRELPTLAPDHEIVYPDIADWLAAALPARQSFVARFRPLARRPAFRAAVDANLRALPEWRPVLHPPRPRPRVHVPPVAPPQDGT